MKVYKSVDMNGQPIENCPSIADDVAVQVDQPTDERVKLWVTPTEDDKNSTPAALKYKDPTTGTFKELDSIAGASAYDAWIALGNTGTVEDFLASLQGHNGENGRDGIAPSVTMENITDDAGEQIGVKLSVTDENGTTSTNILNGTSGSKGVGIVSIDKTGTAGLVDTYTITYSDNSTTTFCITNAGSVEKLSQLENDAGFILDTVNNLVNYYTKEQTYNKEEITDLVAHLSAGIKTKIVAGNASGKPDIALADIDTSTIYLVQEGEAYAQWMWIGSEWAKLGTTAVNLSEYYNKTEIDAKLGLYVSTTALLSILDSYAKTANLAAVATSGDYNDLKNLPEIPDVSGLASTAYVDNKVQEAHNDVDLSQYRKKTDIIQYSEISGAPAGTSQYSFYNDPAQFGCSYLSTPIDLYNALPAHSVFIGDVQKFYTANPSNWGTAWKLDTSFQYCTLVIVRATDINRSIIRMFLKDNDVEFYWPVVNSTGKLKEDGKWTPVPMGVGTGLQISNRGVVSAKGSVVARKNLSGKVALQWAKSGTSFQVATLSASVTGLSNYIINVTKFPQADKITSAAQYNVVQQLHLSQGTTPGVIYLFLPASVDTSKYTTLEALGIMLLVNYCVT